MKRAVRSMLLGLTLIAAVAAMPADTTSVGPDEGERFGIAMVDFEYRPATLTVRPGDVIEFVQTGIQPHNVEFRTVPKGVDLGDTRMGPFLVQKGDVYQLRIDARFAPGVYEFVCTPHELMGMKARFTVVTGS